MGKETGFGRIGVVISDTGKDRKRLMEMLDTQVAHFILLGKNARPEEAVDRIHTIDTAGISTVAAQNLGLEKALELGCDWVLLLHAGARPQKDMLTAMEKAYGSVKKPEEVGMIVPNETQENKPKQQLLKAWYRYWYESKSFGTKTARLENLIYAEASGMLISVAALKAGGRLDESLVTEYIHDDFCLQMAKRRFSILGARDAKLTAKEKPGETANYYYRFRNRLLLWRRYGKAMPGYVMYDLVRMVGQMWHILLFEKDKARKNNEVLNGILDGLRGITGVKNI